VKTGAIPLGVVIAVGRSPASDAHTGAPMLALPAAGQSAAAGGSRAGIILAFGIGMLLSLVPLASAVDHRREARSQIRSNENPTLWQ
jgi:hypothetical protein